MIHLDPIIICHGAAVPLLVSAFPHRLALPPTPVRKAHGLAQAHTPDAPTRLDAIAACARATVMRRWTNSAPLGPANRTLNTRNELRWGKNGSLAVLTTFTKHCLATKRHVDRDRSDGRFCGLEKRLTAVLQNIGRIAKSL